MQTRDQKPRISALCSQSPLSSPPLSLSGSVTLTAPSRFYPAAHTVHSSAALLTCSTVTLWPLLLPSIVFNNWRILPCLHHFPTHWVPGDSFLPLCSNLHMQIKTAGIFFFCSNCYVLKQTCQYTILYGNEHWPEADFPTVKSGSEQQLLVVCVNTTEADRITHRPNSAV